jgi:8-oxo-dGTP pyrophosphatase MutT (NUDIX family)
MPSDLTPRLASTVMLVRDAPSPSGPALEVFVLHRVAGMAFAPSVTVFPGGGVDPSDAQQIPWSGPDPHWWAEALGTAPEQAASLVAAAVRELFEETGVLLAGRGAEEADRQDVTAHRRSLSEVLAGRGLTLRTELLRPWANWVTPVGNPRRYDTFFFLAELPAGQQARLLTTEAESGRWARPADLLAEYAADSLALMPPTLAMLTDLAAAGAVSHAMAQRRQVVPVLPRVVSAPGEPLQVEVDGRILSLRRVND